jgi:hypothetical protein
MSRLSEQGRKISKKTLQLDERLDTLCFLVGSGSKAPVGLAGLMATNEKETCFMDRKQVEINQGQTAVSQIKESKAKKKWQKPKLEDVSGKVMAQPYIRFT